MEAAIEYARKYQEQKPEDIEANIQLGDLLRDSGDLDAAEQHYKQAQLLQNLPVRPTLKLAMITARKGDITAAMRYLEEAEEFAQTPIHKALVRQGVVLLELRLGRINEAIKQTYAQEEFLRQSQGLLELTLSIYTPLINYYVLLDDYESARSALETARGMLAPPLDKFLEFNAAIIHARENDIDAARVSLEQAREVMNQFQLNYLEAQVNLVEAAIDEAQGEYAAMADHYMKAIELTNQSVVVDDNQNNLSQIYAQMAKAQIMSGDLNAAEKSIEAGFRLDPSEPVLWVDKARLQKARNMPQLALASVSYALAIWKDADEHYVLAREARELAAELQSQ
jgi:Flp pilus assembly protein TadD